MAACWFSGLWVWMKLNTWIHTVLPVCAWDFRLSVLSWIVSNGQCQREVLLPQQQSSVAALWGVLATAGSRWYILVLVCTLRWESLKLRLYTVNSFPNSSIYSLLDVSCLLFYSIQIRVSEACRGKISSLHRALSYIRTEMQSTSLTGKCQRKIIPVFVELRAGIVPVALCVFSMMPKDPGLFHSISSVAAS